MFTEVMKSTPWWVWLIVAAGALLVFFLAVVLPTIAVAKGTPRGSRERAFVYQLGGWAAVLTIVSVVLSLTDPSRQPAYSSLFLFALLLTAPWVNLKLKKLRESDKQDPHGKPADRPR